MTIEKPTFHIQRAAKPRHLERLLSTIPDDSIIDVRDIVSSLIDEGYEIDHNGAIRTLNLGNKLGLIEKELKNCYRLTDRGRSCRHLALFRKDVYYEAIHFLMYATWEINGHKDYWSWSYMRICEAFWRARPSRHSSREIFGHLMADASYYFPAMKPAAGTETVDKVVEFIQDLNPPFFKMENTKTVHSKEREWFSVEMALLATYYLYISKGLGISSPILIDESLIETISPLCLASPQIIILMIETASRTFPFLNIHKGEWGSSIILQKTIDITTIT